MVHPRVRIQHRNTTCKIFESDTCAEKSQATDVLSHFMMHASPLNTWGSVCEEVRDIKLTRATLMDTAQPMDIGALEQEKQVNGKQPPESHRERERMRTQTRMFSVLTVGGRDTENVNVVSTCVIRAVVRKLSRTMRRLQEVKHSKKKETKKKETKKKKKEKTGGFSCLGWTHWTAVATWKEADLSSTKVQHSRLTRHSSAQKQPRAPVPVRHLSER